MNAIPFHRQAPQIVPPEDAPAVLARFVGMLMHVIVNFLRDQQRPCSAEEILEHVRDAGHDVSADLIWRVLDGDGGLVAGGYVKHKRDRFTTTAKAL